MILFQLKCEHDHEFEAWFKDGATYEAQAANGDLSCPMCGTSNVGKALMAPRLRTSRQKEVAAEKQKQKAVAEATQAAIAEIRKQVESNCENVGNKFAEEARKIHYGETEKRGIYGQASVKETAELVDEGIDVMALPWDDETKKN
ncbi:MULTISPECIES: DUF1178 family protein [Thalassospira]|jgi:hypothetical protein|uniref:Uncharacterized protein n=1 Tax=Thalassospira profundimaris TaxID=502049 RepID=A0A367V415_9PROT|nr:MULTISPECIES: DUF1178 family protein [Thalassospira]MBR9899765.1 DUF1178 family protein [Rhodospirillales bacterium]KZB70558.1 hypothetical protein AUQ43_06665 [Thalassospira sp. MCCC 1A01148]MBO6805475.1 DUF1178 family protein [Thalassospira sp.]MBO6841724.1 DUF1178 family protein [Thalassospira sp.]MBS8273843.1 DUF1178 family protein [Thalassospira tepidiphila]|tara:strand:- start:607 stop:1041 length:435 start_codon:yes stop_codon:yes gene_type:complete